MDYKKAAIGLTIFFTGVIMLFFEETEVAAYLVLGFGLGLTWSAFHSGGKK